ncbi:hypothetical protein LCGC14_1396820, partial [marine sediment metagenome]
MQPTFKQFLSEVRYYNPRTQITPLFTDDWLIFGKKHSAGEWHITDAELWPDWLDYDKDPSEMGQKEFFNAIKEIISKHKRPPSGWRNYRDWWMNTGGGDERNYQLSVQELDQLERKRGTLSETQYYKNRDLEDCPDCRGRGGRRISYQIGPEDWNTDWDSCDECGGSGKITKLRKAR